MPLVDNPETLIKIADTVMRWSREAEELIEEFGSQDEKDALQELFQARNLTRKFDPVPEVFPKLITMFTEVLAKGGYFGAHRVFLTEMQHYFEKEN